MAGQADRAMAHRDSERSNRAGYLEAGQEQRDPDPEWERPGAWKWSGIVMTRQWSYKGHNPRKGSRIDDTQGRSSRTHGNGAGE